MKIPSSITVQVRKAFMVIKYRTLGRLSGLLTYET